jgi:protein SCO1/2
MERWLMKFSTSLRSSLSVQEKWINLGMVNHQVSRLLTLLTLSLGLISSVQAKTDTPLEMKEVDVKENLGKMLPLDLQFKDETNQDVSLKTYFKGDKPVLLTLVYYNCPMLCNLILNGVVEGIKELNWVPGDEFEVISVSISPRETPKLASEKKASYMKQLGMEKADQGWHFLTGQKEAIKSLANAVGFNFQYDPSTQDYAHGAVIFFISPDGTISRYLYGASFEEKQLRLALTEAGQGKTGSIVDRFLLRCFQYEPSHQKYAFYIWGAMRTGGALTILFLGFFIFGLWRGEKQRQISLTHSEQA